SVTLGPINNAIPSVQRMLLSMTVLPKSSVTSTVATASVPRDPFPQKYVARLAVDQRFAGRGLGHKLISPLSALSPRGCVLWLGKRALLHLQILHEHKIVSVSAPHLHGSLIKPAAANVEPCSDGDFDDRA